MTMIIQRTPVAAGLPFTLADHKAYLRLDHDDENASIESMGDAAASEVERFAEIALLTQTITVNHIGYLVEAPLRLPIGPGAPDPAVTVAVDGAPFSGFDLIAGFRPVLSWHSDLIGQTFDLLTIEYTAGFGGTAGDIPSDLKQAIADQMALMFDGRSPMDRLRDLTSSPHMARIAARYRGVQL